MKCLLFIITFFSIGKFIDVQGENDADSNLSGDDPASFEKSEDNSPEELGQSTNHEVASKDKISEKKDTDKKRQNLGNIMGTGETEQFLAEIQEGDNSDLIGQNQHIKQSNFYNDLGRRSLAQALKNYAAENADYLTPEKAPPELVLLVAKESALLRSGKDTDLGSDFDRNKILRSGHYWNGVWKEEVNPKNIMRSSSQKKILGSIKAKINPGTEFYKVVSRMKKISPQLLYIINKKQP